MPPKMNRLNFLLLAQHHPRNTVCVRKRAFDKRREQLSSSPPTALVYSRRLLVRHEVQTASDMQAKRAYNAAGRGGL
jgi:hypothetical protein